MALEFPCDPAEFEVPVAGAEKLAACRKLLTAVKLKGVLYAEYTVAAD